MTDNKTDHTIYLQQVYNHWLDISKKKKNTQNVFLIATIGRSGVKVLEHFVKTYDPDFSQIRVDKFVYTIKCRFSIMCLNELTQHRRQNIFATFTYARKVWNAQYDIYYAIY